MSDTPSNDVLQERIKNLDDRFRVEALKSRDSRDKIFNKLEEIHTQTLKTNGRVNKHDQEIKCLEEKHEGSQFFQGRASVFFWLIMVSVAAVIGVLIKS